MLGRRVCTKRRVSIIVFQEICFHHVSTYHPTFVNCDALYVLTGVGGYLKQRKTITFRKEEDGAELDRLKKVEIEASHKCQVRNVRILSAHRRFAFLQHVPTASEAADLLRSLMPETNAHICKRVHIALHPIFDVTSSSSRLRAH